METTYRYSENADALDLGKQIGQFGKGTTFSNDGFENYTKGLVLQEFGLKGGQFKILSSKSFSWTSGKNSNESFTVTDPTALNSSKYDVSSFVFDASGWSLSSAMRETVDGVSSDVSASDGSWNKQEMLTTYDYYANGQQKAVGGQSGHGVTFSNDGFGNITAGSVEQIFEQKTFDNGSKQYKLMKSISRSWTSNNLGGGSWSQDANKQWTFTANVGGGNFGVGADATKRVGDADIPNRISGVDGSWSEQEMVTLYDYDTNGRQKTVDGQAGFGITLSNDGFGNYTVGSVRQRYELVEMKNNAKQFKIMSSTSRSWSGNVRSTGAWWDGSGGVRNLTTAAAVDHALDNKWVSLTERPALTEINSDGSWNKQEMITVYDYYPKGRSQGKQRGQYGIGQTFGDDGFENYTKGRILQKYEIRGTMFKIVSSKSFSWTSDSRGAGDFNIPHNRLKWLADKIARLPSAGKIRILEEGMGEPPFRVGLGSKKGGAKIQPMIGLSRKGVDTEILPQPALDERFASDEDSPGNYDFERAISAGWTLTGAILKPDGTAITAAVGSWNKQVMETTYQYNDSTKQGKITGQAGSGSTFSNDGFDNFTSGSIQQSYREVAAGLFKIDRSVSKSWTSDSNGYGAYGVGEGAGQNKRIGSGRVTGVDGSWSEQEMVTIYDYDTNGKQKAGSDGQKGYGITLSNDCFENYTIGTIKQEYRQVEIKNGASVGTQYKIDKSISRSWSGNVRGVLNWDHEATFASMESWLTNEWKGLETAPLSSYQNSDGSWSKQEMVTKYEYYGKDEVDGTKPLGGKQKGQYGIGKTFGDDGFNNYTRGMVLQKFELKGGQFKVVSSKNFSWTSGLSTAEKEDSFSIPETLGWDASSNNFNFASVEDSWILTGPTDFVSTDGSWSKQKTETTYQYRDPAKAGKLTGQSGTGSTFACDGIGGYTRGTIEQRYRPVTVGRVTLFKMDRSISKSWTSDSNGYGAYGVGEAVGYTKGVGTGRVTSLDGSWSEQEMVTLYDYDSNGKQKSGSDGQKGYGVSLTNDGFGNYNVGIINQVYKQVEITNGGGVGSKRPKQFKMDKSISRSWSGNLSKVIGWSNTLSISAMNSWAVGAWRGLELAPIAAYRNSDGSWNKQETTTVYDYESGGKQRGQYGIGKTFGDDGFLNYTKGMILQKYEKKGGQFKMVNSKSFTWTSGLPTFIKTDSQTIPNTLTWDEASGNFDFESAESDWILNSVPSFKSGDDSWNKQLMETSYEYDDSNFEGKVTGQSGHGATLSNDGLGNVTAGSIEQSYRKITVGAVVMFKLEKSVSKTWTSNSQGGGAWTQNASKQWAFTANAGSGSYEGDDDSRLAGGDGSWSKQKMETIYSYDDNTGKQTKQEGYGVSLGNDGFDNYTAGKIVQEYGKENIRNGSSKSTGEQYKIKSYKSWSWGSKAGGIGSWNLTAKEPALPDGDKEWRFTSNIGSYENPVPGGDLSWSKQYMETSYEYNKSGAEIGKQSRQYGIGDTFSNDGFDNYTKGKIIQLYEQAPPAKGSFKLARSYSYSWTSNAKGEGSYDNVNKSNLTLTGWDLSGPAAVVDADGTGRSITTLDSSWNKQEMMTIYTYGEGGKQTNQEGLGVSLSNDGFDNYTAGSIAQTYDLKENGSTGPYWKITSSTNKTWTSDSSGGGSWRQSYKIAPYVKMFIDTIRGSKQYSYTYLIAGREWAFDSNLGSGSFASPLANSDGSWSKQEMTTTYSYDDNGKQDGQRGSGKTASNDGFDNYTAGTIQQKFDLIGEENKGQYWKIGSSTSRTWSSKEIIVLADLPVSEVFINGVRNVGNFADRQICQ